MADDCHPSVMDPFEVYTSERSLSLALSEHGGEDTEFYRAVSIEASSVNSTTKNLRLTCDPCRILHRPCRNGSPTTPCDRCVDRNVTCVFNSYGTFVEQRKRRRKGKSATGEDSQAESDKKIMRNSTVPAAGFDPIALGLRRKCNFCHLRGRACVNGSNTTPCASCRKRNLICIFGVRKSVVDKNGLSEVADKNYNGRYSDLTVAHPADIMEQHEPGMEEDEDGQSEINTAESNEQSIFISERVWLEEDHTMHPWETLAARHMFGYKLMDSQEGSISVDMIEE